MELKHVRILFCLKSYSRIKAAATSTRRPGDHENVTERVAENLV